MDTMPERVWLTPDPYAMSGDWWADGKTVREDGEVPYVPEQRALDAERERDEWIQEAQKAATSRLALRADLRALSPFAETRVAELEEYFEPRGSIPKDVDAARLVLARLDREGT